VERITNAQDAYGHELWASVDEGLHDEIVERDDGFISRSDGPKRYFADFKAWARREQHAMRFVQRPLGRRLGGRALDVGSGAGRVSLYLQRRGMKVTAIDSSPLAVRLCRRRGVKDARVLPFEQIHRLPAASFDLVVMFGNNFGLFGSRKKARRLLLQLHRLTSPNAVILAESLNPYGSGVAAHRRYLRRNRQRGRMAGQIRIRIRFRDIKGPWFEYLLVSPTEMRNLVAGTGWTIRRIFRDRGPLYVAVIGKIASGKSTIRSAAGNDS
jgi:SAM-dependent methyltransferase